MSGRRRGDGPRADSPIDADAQAGAAQPTGVAGATAIDAELERLREEIDALDRRIVQLLNQRARLARAVGAAKARRGRPIRDPEREREVLLRVSMANEGPTPQADLLALYKRLIASARELEARERTRLRAGTPEPREAR